MDYSLRVFDTLAKLNSVMANHKNPRIAYSGGSDSDIVAHLVETAGYSVQKVFYDTGIEFAATKEHVRRQSDVVEIKPLMSVPKSNKTYGSPLINKRVSDYLYRMQQHGFDFFNHSLLNFDELMLLYPGLKTALMWWTNGYEDDSQFNISRNKCLKEFIVFNGGIGFPVSNKCCDGAKKYPMRAYAKENNVDLLLLGIRKAEGGSRAGAYKSCYTKTSKDSYHIYMPLFYWSNRDKARYKIENRIKYSRLYTKYGMERGGCAGCPFGKKFINELRIIKRHEPNLYNGISKIFKNSYSFTLRYRQFIARKKHDDRQMEMRLWN